MSRGGPPKEVGEVLERARANAGRRAAPSRSSATEAPLERFERLAAEFHRDTGLLAPGKDAPAASGGFPTERERADRWTAWLAERRRAAAAPPPEPEDPRPNSPEDLGARPPPSAAAPRHDPKVCSSCPAPILWAQILELDERGRWSRVKNPDTGRFKSMPVDFRPDPEGNVILFHRDGEGVVCRVLKNGEAPPPGARLRKSHFATCPNAARHRKGRGRR
jgi:hypothetical protein